MTNRGARLWVLVLMMIVAVTGCLVVSDSPPEEEEGVLFRDEFTSEESLSVWEFIPEDQVWEFVAEDGGFLRVPAGVENATAQVELPLTRLGADSEFDRIIVEVDYRLYQYNDNAYFKLYLLNNTTKDGYGIHVYAGANDWKYGLVKLQNNETSELGVFPGTQRDDTDRWTSVQFILEKNGVLRISRDGTEVGNKEIATGGSIGEFDLLFLSDRHGYTRYEFGRIEIRVE